MGHRTTKTKNKLKVHKTIESRTDFFYYTFRNILLFGAPLLIISDLVLSHLSLHSSATSSGTDNVQLILSTSCTINAVVTAEHTGYLNGGQLDNNVGNTKLSAYCNDNNGYGIYAVGSSGNTDGNTDLISNINEGYNIRTGVYDSNNTVNPSSWAMKLTAGSGSGIDPVTGESVPTTPPTIINGYDNYSAIPNVYTLVAKRTSGTSMTTDTSISGSYLNTTYQIYANSAQPSGTYNGKVKYVMVHPQSNNQHFGFNEVFAVNGKSIINVDGNSYYAMQDMTSDICSKVGILNEASQTQLVDIRDNKLYWVAKLEDGHCWMTQNLDFDIVADEQDPAKMKTLTSEDTDLIDHSLTGAYANGYSYDENTGIISWTPSNSAISAGSWSSQNYHPYSKDIGIKYPDSMVTKTAAGAHALSGNYYNWTAAIASNDSSSLINSTYSNVDINPQNSVCPKGWRLPTISSAAIRNEFGKLISLYGATPTQIMANPLWFIRSGGIWSKSVGDSGITGRYWSSTVSSSSRSHYMYFNNSQILSNDTNNRYEEYSVRCLAR